MIYSTASIPVNPDCEPPLTRERPAEQAQFDSEKGYKAALLSTVKRTRELLAEGEL